MELGATLVTSLYHELITVPQSGVVVAIEDMKM